MTPSSNYYWISLYLFLLHVFEPTSPVFLYSIVTCAFNRFFSGQAGANMVLSLEGVCDKYGIKVKQSLSHFCPTEITTGFHCAGFFEVQSTHGPGIQFNMWRIPPSKALSILLGSNPHKNNKNTTKGADCLHLRKSCLPALTQRKHCCLLIKSSDGFTRLFCFYNLKF